MTTHQGLPEGAWTKGKWAVFNGGTRVGADGGVSLAECSISVLGHPGIGQLEQRANAARIVLAVNSHDALVEALDKAGSALIVFAGIMREMGETSRADVMDAHAASARAVLSLAKGAA